MKLGEHFPHSSALQSMSGLSSVSHRNASRESEARNLDIKTCAARLLNEVRGPGFGLCRFAVTSGDD